jgi:uncharacterized protein DUF692
MNRSDFAPLGFGVGLRRPHYVHILEQHPPMDWFEVISEDFMGRDAWRVVVELCWTGVGGRQNSVVFRPPPGACEGWPEKLGIMK